MRYLLIEDTKALARSLVERLALDGHGVDWAANLEEAEELVGISNYDLILLDMTLPDGNGRDFLERHRRAKRDTPVIVITARSAVSDRIDTLDIGADDYVTKPFDVSELEARCRAVLRRRHGATQTLQSFADITFDPLAATLSVEGEARALRSRELRLLEIFLSAPNRIFSKEDLCDRLFSLSEAVTDNAIEVYVLRLRKKLAGSRAQIETVRGVGYRLIEA